MLVMITKLGTFVAETRDCVWPYGMDCNGSFYA